MERQIKFKHRGQTLYGMLHLPAGRRRAPAVLLLHGFTGSRVETHRLFIKASRDYAKRGLASLRFDFLGSGESEGDFRLTRLGAWIQQAVTALGFLAKQGGVDAARLGVQGLSMGGAAAASLAGLDQRVKALALWNAVADPLSRVENAFGTPAEKKRWRRDGVRDLGGLLLDSAFLDDLARQKPLERLKAYKWRALVMHASKDQVVPPFQGAYYMGALGPRADWHGVKGADHGYSRADWEAEAIKVTAAWFKKSL